MVDLLRQEVVAVSSAVVKVGTRVLTHADGTLNSDTIDHLAQQICELYDQRKTIFLVSSGAVGAGLNRLQINERPTDLAQLQAVAAVGQTRLIESYDRIFRQHGRHAAQVLLTIEDFHDRDRYLNARNTLLALQQFGAVAIINENDTVAVEELSATFGDNDRLAALVTNALRAPLLIILSDVDGLYDGPPESPDSRVVSTVTELDESIQAMVRDKKSGLSKGGMASKLEAARIATTAGENVIIAGGRVPNILTRIFAAEPVGTVFLAKGKTISPRKRWIGFTAKPCGRLTLDEGASRAIATGGKSLLAIGVTSVVGSFEKGDVVEVFDHSGKCIARGLTNYATADLQRIAGKHSEAFAEILGRSAYREVIHRNNLATM